MQLKADDELVVVDDFSTDGSVRVLEEFQDKRIRIIAQPANTGHVKAFERAIMAASSDVILLADQDDVWLPGRVDLLVEELQRTRSLLVVSNFGQIDEAGAPLPEPRYRVKEAESTRYLANIAKIFLGRTSCFGCTMAFRRGLLETAIPIPSFVESHDIWLALICNMLGQIHFCEKQTLLRRIHGRNATALRPRPIHRVIKSRVTFLLSIVVVLCRRCGVGRKVAR